LRARRGGLGLALLLAWGCGAEPAGDELSPRDARYRVALRSADPGPLELRFEPREGWHIEPDATAHLALEAPEGFALPRAEQSGEEALEHSEEALAFGVRLERLASGPEQQVTVRGAVKFGVCRDDASTCEIVRRDLEFEAPAG